MSSSLPLLANATATGTGKATPRGLHCFEVVSSNFNGATVSLQKLGPDGATYLDVSGFTALTANGAVMVALPGGIYRAAVSGGPPTAVYASLSPIAL